MSRRPRAAIASLLLLFAVLAATTRASAWVEVHVTGDDVRLTIDRSGLTRVEHRIALKIAGGPLPSLEVRGVDEDAIPEPDGYIVPARDATSGSLASAIPVHVEATAQEERRRSDGSPREASLRVVFQGKGATRGAFVVFLRYTTRLGERAIERDGNTARVRWRGPLWDDGLESARTTFVLPAAPNEPRPDEELGATDDEGPVPIPATFLSTVRRGPEKDEIELLRPYAPKGEPILWTIRVDARALRAEAPKPASAAAPPIVAPSTVELFDGARRTLIFGGAGLLFVLYSLLVAQKSRQVARHAIAAGTNARPVVPLPTAIRSVGAGLALVVGIGIQAVGRLTIGACVVLVAVALAAHRTPKARRGPLRGPGRWLSVSETEAFRDPPRPSGASLDVSTRLGKVLLLLLLGVVGALAAGAVTFGHRSIQEATLLGFDAVALLAVFCTGRINELPPDPAVHPVKLLREVARRVRRCVGDAEVRLVPRIRVPIGKADPDELRLSIAPRFPLRGLVAIEIGVAYAQGAGGWIGLPEVLLRVTAGSDCERGVASLARFGRAMRGRRPEERVIAFSPRLPGARMTAAIAASLVVRVVDRERARPAAPLPKKTKKAA
jgi:hypothetical protein